MDASSWHRVWALDFGGNKLIAKLSGTPLIQYVIQATENLFEKRVVVTRHDK